MSALPNHMPMLVEFPPPRAVEKGRISFGRSSPGTLLRSLATPAPKLERGPIVEPDEQLADAAALDPDFLEEKREVARLQAEAMERLRAAKELEVLLAARERLLNEREQALAARERGAAGRTESGYAAITDPSLAEQAAFLREREAFIEQSENTLFEKAQHLQEWETRLQQQAHDQGGA